MKIEHMVIIALLLVLIFMQARSNYGVENPTKTSISSTSNLGFYGGSAPSL